MVQLFRLTDIENDQDIGVITEDQLQFLIDNLEEEGLEEQDYYIDEDTLNFLAANDCDVELLAMLTEALEGRISIDIRYEMV